MFHVKRLLSLGFILLTFTACEGLEVSSPDSFERGNDEWQQRDKQKSILGGDGLTFGGNDKKQATQGTGIGVNAFLWRATLDTVSFMPLVSADPFGGVILTDWHSANTAPNERFKLNIYILGQALRADGIRVAAFRQNKNESNEWQPMAVEPKVVTDIENAILTRARQLRSESMTQ